MSDCLQNGQGWLISGVCLGRQSYASPRQVVSGIGRTDRVDLDRFGSTGLVLLMGSVVEAESCRWRSVAC